MDDFGINTARSLATRVVPHCSDVSARRFVETAVGVESGGWVHKITESLKTHLPPDFPGAAEVIVASLGPEWPTDQAMPDAHVLTPMVNYVAVHGGDHLESSMHALYELSKRTYTAQAGVRQFLAASAKTTMPYLQRWTADTSPHVRRMVATASRPRLRYPVMPGLTDLTEYRANPKPVLKLIDPLKDDPAPPVRKAVAGNLSDIAKDTPDLVFERMENWLGGGADAGPPSKHVKSIVRQALKYHARKGNARAIELLEKAR